MYARRLLLALIAGACAVTLRVEATATEPAAVPTPYHRVPDRDNLTPDQKKAETFVAKLFARARTAAASNDYATASTAYEDALKVLEEAYGPDNDRITEALRGIVNTRVSWDNYSAQYGFGQRAGLVVAVKAQERIVSIYEGREDIDPYERVAALVDLGDCYLYTDDPRAIDTYRKAWQLQSRLVSSQTADEMFGSVGLVRLVLPENPQGHSEWRVTVTYDVASDGKVTVSEVDGNAPQEVNEHMRDNYAHARFRPRLVGGEPVDTHGITYTHKYAGTSGRQNFRA